MRTKTEMDPRWAELLGRGYNLRGKDGDVAVALYYKEAFIADFTQTTVIMEEVINEAEQHWQEIMGGTNPRWCRNCEEWHQTKPFMGNCQLHHWKEDKYSQDADAGICPDFKDRCAKYQAASTKKEV